MIPAKQLQALRALALNGDGRAQRAPARMISAKQLQALRALALNGDGRAQRALVRLAERELDPMPELVEENEQGPALELDAAPVYPARHGFWIKVAGFWLYRDGTIEPA